MKQGIPLNDEDRTPWLLALLDELKRLLAEGRSAILACSACASLANGPHDAPPFQILRL
jgi:gluconate kinase